MGTVTNLDEFRSKKALEKMIRPMSDDEWENYVAASESGLFVTFELQRIAMIRGIDITQELHALKGRISFYHALRRCSLRMELIELSEKFGFSIFNQYIRGEL